MTPEEAIEILDDRYHKWPGPVDPDFEDSILLGIEALEAYQKAQEAGWYPPGYKLPGETEE